MVMTSLILCAALHAAGAPASDGGFAAPAPGVVPVALASAGGAAVPVLIGTGLIGVSAVVPDEGVAFLTATLGLASLAGGPVGSAVGALVVELLRDGPNTATVVVAAFCGGLIGAVVGVGGGFALWSLALRDQPLGVLLPIAGAWVFEPLGAAMFAAVTVEQAE